MSYDLTIGEEDRNFTFNINAIIPFKCDSLKTLRGKRGEVAEMIIVTWIQAIMRNPDYYREQCSDDWGTFNECLGFLMELIALSQAHPQDTWEVYA